MCFTDSTSVHPLKPVLGAMPALRQPLPSPATWFTCYALYEHY